MQSSQRKIVARRGALWDRAVPPEHQISYSADAAPRRIKMCPTRAEDGYVTLRFPFSEVRGGIFDEQMLFIDRLHVEAVLAVSKDLPVVLHAQYLLLCHV